MGIKSFLQRGFDVLLPNSIQIVNHGSCTWEIYQGVDEIRIVRKKAP